MQWIELFAGAGGAAVGIKQAGGVALECVEWDANACDTLRAAGFPVWEGDVRDWPPEFGDRFPFAEVDAMWSSFPCQGWSTAGLRKGQADYRNGWPWTVDAIDVVKPTWFVAENVPGLRMHSRACRQGRTCTGECARTYLDEVIIPQLRERFAWAEWRELNAADYGVPQHRRRIFIVAGPTPITWPAPTHADPKAEQFFWGRKPWRSFGEALGLTGTLDGGRNSSANPKQEKVRGSEAPAPTVGGKGNQMVRIIGGGRNPQAAGIARTYRDLTDEPSTTVVAQPAGNAGPWVCDERAARILAGPSVTVCGTDGVGLGSAKSRDLVERGTGRRRLTWQECAILQDFPPDHPFKGTKKSIYQQIGNAVPPTLARVIAAAIAEAHNE